MVKQETQQHTRSGKHGNAASPCRYSLNSLSKLVRRVPLLLASTALASCTESPVQPVGALRGLQSLTAAAATSPSVVVARVTYERRTDGRAKHELTSVASLLEQRHLGRADRHADLRVPTDGRFGVVLGVSDRGTLLFEALVRDGQATEIGPNSSAEALLVSAHGATILDPASQRLPTQVTTQPAYKALADLVEDDAAQDKSYYDDSRLRQAIAAVKIETSTASPSLTALASRTSTAAPILSLALPGFDKIDVNSDEGGTLQLANHSQVAFDAKLANDKGGVLEEAYVGPATITTTLDGHGASRVDLTLSLLGTATQYNTLRLARAAVGAVLVALGTSPANAAADDLTSCVANVFGTATLDQIVQSSRAESGDAVSAMSEVLAGEIIPVRQCMTQYFMTEFLGNLSEDVAKLFAKRAAFVLSAFDAAAWLYFEGPFMFDLAAAAFAEPIQASFCRATDGHYERFVAGGLNACFPSLVSAAYSIACLNCGPDGFRYSDLEFRIRFSGDVQDGTIHLVTEEFDPNGLSFTGTRDILIDASMIQGDEIVFQDGLWFGGPDSKNVSQTKTFTFVREGTTSNSVSIVVPRGSME